jgi:4-hydroxybenzoate polyprenyltransferase
VDPVSTLVGAISFDDSGHQLGRWLRRVFFSVCYNTTFIANALFAVGATTPFLVYAAVTGTVSAALVVKTLAAVLLSTGAYSLIYIVNDFIDRAKDERLGIPKQTARHVLGERYLWWLALVYGVAVAVSLALWWQLGVAWVAYAAGMTVLSLAHSKARRLKLLTVFVERWAKFCAPLILLCAAGGGPGTGPMLAGAVIAYPLGFMADYSLKGYMEGRLALTAAWRWYVYAAYWLVAAVTLVSVAGGWTQVAADGPKVGVYELFYFGVMALTYAIARVWRLGFLDDRYPPVVAREKRQLLSYGLIQVLVIIGACCAAVR